MGQSDFKADGEGGTRTLDEHLEPAHPQPSEDVARELTASAGRMRVATENAPAARKRSGAGHGGLSSMPRKTLEERFWEKVDRRGPDECWPWQASCGSRGHGQFDGGELGRSAHRVAYQLTHGLLEDQALVVHHRCENPPCCNPAHLEPTTNRRNILTGTSFSAVNAAKTHCYKGHEFTEENTYLDGRRRRQCIICKNRASAEYKRRMRAAKRAEREAA